MKLILHRLVRLVVLEACLLLASLAVTVAQVKTRNVVLIVTDGLR